MVSLIKTLVAIIKVIIHLMKYVNIDTESLSKFAEDLANKAA